MQTFNIINLLRSYNLLGGPQYQPIFKQKCLKNRKSKLEFWQNFFERIFNKLSNDTQVDRPCTCSSVVIDD